ncbi:MAG: hypothetical protein EX285_05595 [Thaumarchaeota archaeon]|nr:hypothetical protein [Nitrososphaerota archaeon]
MVREDLEGWHWAYGYVQNVNILLQVEHTTLSRRRFSTKVEIKTKNSQIIYVALKPDINNSIEGHISTNLKLIGDTIFLNIDTDDLSHLRASLNSYLRLAKSAISCLDITL